MTRAPFKIATKLAPLISNVEAECALLGGLMMDNRLIDRAADMVGGEDFAEPLCGRIFAAIQREHSLSRPANAVTLKPYFVNDPAAIELGGVAFLAELTGSGAAILGALDFAAQIAELAGRRRFAESLLECAAQAEDYERGIEELAGLAEGAISDALRSDSGGQSMSAGKAVEAALNAQYEDAPGITCGIIPSLDHALGPICPGDSVILAGRPGMCKTALALSYAHGVAEQGHGVTVISLEMRAEQLGARLACDVLFDTPDQLPYSAITGNRCDNSQLRALARASLKIQDWPLWIEDLGFATTGRLAAIVRKHKRRLAARGKLLRLVIVDYLQLLSPDRPGKNIYEDTTRVSRALKALAKSEGVGVLALCQLSREVERRNDKRPTTSDLRDSGQIEQDADAICFLLRREEYLQREEPNPDSLEHDAWERGFEKERGKIEFIVTKRRAGVSGIGRGLWYGKFQAVRG